MRKIDDSENNAACLFVGSADIITRGVAFSAHALAFLFLLLLLTLFFTCCKGILAAKIIIRAPADVVSRLVM